MKATFPPFLGFKTLALFSAVALFTACGSDDDETPTPQPQTNTTPTTPQPSDAHAVLAAVNVAVASPVIIPGMPTTITMGTAVAAFFTAPGSTTYQDAGTVKLNTSDLTKNQNNTYVFQPSATNPTGLDLSSGVNWQVTGAGDIPAFSKSVGDMPQMPVITSDSVITKASGYTFTINPISTGDSILFIISSDNNTFVSKTKHRSATTCTFTAAELSGLANSSQALMQANVYSITSQVYSGKKVYFVNQASTNKTGVKIQ